jgi:hypothetical protein
MKSFLILSFLVFPLITLAGESTVGDCGEYKIKGIARMINHSPLIIVNEHTISQYTFSIPISEEPRIAPFIDSAFELTATIVKKLDGTKGQARDLKDITLRIQHPLGDTPDTGFKLLTKLPCQK